MMLRLKTLGGLALLGPDGAPAVSATQRRRLAVLALAASARETGFSRDKAMALLWSEVDAERARHSLGQLVYALRRETTGAELLAATGELRLDPAVIEVDRWRFEDAMRRGAIEEAVDCYAGDFLDGFHLPDAPEFERWVDGERAELAQRYQQALEQLAGAATSRSDHAAAVAWWTRVSTLDPLSGRVAAAVMRALADAGEFSAAQRHALAYEATLKAETGATPDPVVLRAIGEISRRAERSSARREAAVNAEEPQILVAPVSAPEPSTVVPVPVSIAAPALPKRSDRARTLGVFAIVGALAVVAFFVMRRNNSPTSATASAASATADDGSTTGLAVLPFRGSTDSAGRYLRDAIPVLLAAALDGVGPLRSVDGNAVARAAAPEKAGPLPGPGEGSAIARSVGARAFVLGEAASASGRVRLAATMYDAKAGTPIARAVADGPADSLFAVVDRLAALLAANFTDARKTSLIQVAGRTTTSLTAFKRFLDGEIAFREARMQVAEEAFRDAIAADTTFALAQLRLANVYEWTGDYRSATRTLGQGARNIDRLPPRERDLLTINSARIAGAPSSTVDVESIARAVIARRPDDAPFLLELGEILFHGNPPRGRTMMEARDPFRRAAQLDPAVSWEPLFHLAQIAALSGQAAEADSLARRLPSATSDRLVLITRAVQSASSLNRAAMDSVVSALVRRPASETIFNVEFATAVALMRGDTAMARSIVEPLTAPEVPAGVRGAAWARVGLLESALGNWSHVEPAFDQALRIASRDTAALRDMNQLRARLLSLPIARVSETSKAAAREALERSAPRASSSARWLHAATLARTGDTAAALALTDTLVREPVRLEEQRFLRAELLWNAGRRDEALRWYTAATEGPFGVVFLDVARARRLASVPPKQP